MRRIWVVGGTTEGRQLLSSGLPILYTVTTEYGAWLVGENPNVEIRVGSLNEAAMGQLLVDEDIACVLDATHPYATEASRNAKASADKQGIPYRRVIREAPWEAATSEGVVRVSSYGEAAAYLASQAGRALLTIGSKELAAFTHVPDFQGRLFVRVLPTTDVLEHCLKLGYSPGRIIAMQGPFSREMNSALLRETKARFLVTKDSGSAGGFLEKVEAARDLGVTVVLIARPWEEGVSVKEAIDFAREELGTKVGVSD